MRKLTALLLAIVLSVAGCGVKEAVTEESAVEATSEVTEVDDSEEDDDSVDYYHHTSDYDWHFVYNGVRYTFPMNVEDFVVEGFRGENVNLLFETMYPGATADIDVWGPDEEYFQIRVMNKDNEPLSLGKCRLISIRTRAYDEDEVVADFIAPTGTAMGSSWEEFTGENLPGNVSTQPVGGEGQLLIVSKVRYREEGSLFIDYVGNQVRQIWITYYGE